MWVCRTVDTTVVTRGRPETVRAEPEVVVFRRAGCNRRQSRDKESRLLKGVLDGSLGKVAFRPGVFPDGWMILVDIITSVEREQELSVAIGRLNGRARGNSLKKAR